LTGSFPKNMGKIKKVQRHKSRRHLPELITAVVASADGEIFELEGYAAVGMAGPMMEPLTVGATTRMPFGGELMYLPDRTPLLYHIKTGGFETVSVNPYDPGEPIFPVAAFNSPGYVVTRHCAYQERGEATLLPLFSYGAVGWYGNGFRSPLVRVDKEPRQDLRRMKPEDVKAGVKRIRRRLPENRLREHLERCALTYGCPAGKNFFLGRYEAPLPVSNSCNARCLGCLSLQQEDEISCSQNRIDFTPDSEEITAVALEHIRNVPNGVVSFGQGCEGDPLMAADTILPAIEGIRKQTPEGTINMNTNGSRPHVLKALFDAGLDSIRISMNSVRPACYDTYFRPRGYGFSDVIQSIDMALGKARHVALNYLNLSGFTDTPEETDALLTFLEKHPVDMIQWRNLNYDPLRYHEAMNRVAAHGSPIGLEKVLHRVRKKFPELNFGYFNPPKESWRRK